MNVPNPFRRPLRAFVFALAVAGVCPAATTRPAGPAAVPLRAVTLYTSGVGFFRHDAVVTGDGTAVLTFKTAQVNDVLKSLVVQDAGGRVTGVNYPSQDPLDKTLKGFQIDLSDNPSLGELLRQLRGARVGFETTDGDTHAGTLVGMSKKAVARPQVAAVDAWFATLLEDGQKLTQVRLDDVRSVTLADPVLNAELQQALAAIATGRDQDKKPVTIAFTGVGEHRLRAGYVVEAPVWKTSYRLLMNDAPANAAKDDGAKAAPATRPKAQDFLQGWAVVENQTDADWADVSLSLVSGRPISFVTDLYTPLYLQRPVVELNSFQGLRPQVYQEGMQSPAPGAAGGAGVRGTVLARKASNAPMAASPMAEAAASDGVAARGFDEAMFADASVRSPAITAKLGELFQYTIEHVNLPRQQSSLVPIVTDAIEVEPLSIYNETVLPRNPLTGAVLTNGTGKLLPQGPVTVLSGGAYAGDARIEDLPAGQKRMLSFGVDLQTLVDVKSEEKLELVGGKLVKGVLVLSRRRRTSKAYAVQNKGDNDKTVIVEHARDDDWSLVDSPEPYDTTDRRYRFRWPVPKGETKTLTVTQQRVIQESLALVDANFDRLAFVSREGGLPPKVREAVADVVRRRQAVADLEQQAKAKADALGGLTGEQSRLRENMKVVDKADPYYQRLLTKLNAQEGVIESLQKDRDDLAAKATAATADLSASLEKLSVE